MIAADEAEARATLEDMLVGHRFGDAPVVVEEFLEGVELSVLALCDGETALPLAPARDFKRIGEGDTGPNTGGMGAFSPVDGADAALIEDVRVRGSASRSWTSSPAAARRSTACSTPGLMLTADGPKVIEFNVRFGDPETQVVLPRLRSDLLDLFQRARRRPAGCAGAELEWDARAAVTVVLASRGYPASSSSGDVISGLDGDRRRGHPRGDRRARRRDRHRGRAGAERDRARRGSRSRPAGRVCCRRPDHLRWQDLPPGHRRMTEPTTQTEVETELDGLEVDAPHVGIVMGSKSDMPAMEKAAKELTERGILHEIRVMSAHRDPEMVAEYAKNAQHARAAGDHRRRRPGRRAAGRGRRAHRPAGDRRAADVARRRSPAGWTRCSRSPRCRPGVPGGAAWASTTPATPRCSPRAYSNA